MPLTPYHLGPAFLVGLLLLSCIDFPTFVIASVIVDVEPMVILLLKLDMPLHGFFHSFIGGTLAALALTAFMAKFRKSFSGLLSFFRLERETSLKGILAAALLGVYIHLLLDSTMHADMQPFYPLAINPLLEQGPLAGLTATMICVWCFIGAIVVYAAKLLLIWRRQKATSE
jgi:membrane-bound metal-dependent hydrolase YbcI (DUF457 family)